MSSNKESFEKLDRLVIDIYRDYNLNSFPIDIFDLANKMGIKIIKYSSYDDLILNVLNSISSDGFYLNNNKCPMIFINDLIKSKERIRMTLAHEIKHFVCEDKMSNNESELFANHFARYLLCPTPYLIYKNYNSALDIMYEFGISYEASRVALKNCINRRNRYNDTLFEYEQVLINLFI